METIRANLQQRCCHPVRYSLCPLPLGESRVGHAVMVHSEPPEQKQTSTERIYELISRIRKLPKPNGVEEIGGEPNGSEPN